MNVGGMPCCIGLTPKQRRGAFFDIASVLGQHYHFGFEEYKRMKTSELIELYSRFSKEMKRQKRLNRNR